MSPVVAEERWWDGPHEHVRLMMGFVGIFTMLGLRPEGVGKVTA